MLECSWTEIHGEYEFYIIMPVTIPISMVANTKLPKTIKVE